MKKGLIALLCLSLMGGAAQAAGVNRIIRGTVNETLLQGYVATPPAGWARNFIYSVASPATDAVQKIAVISAQRRTAQNTTPPTPIGLTTLTAAGAILTKDVLPAGAQITAAQCLASPLNCTAPLLVSVRPDQAVPGRLLVTVMRQLITPPSPIPTLRIITYAFDPAAAVGTADRWTLIDNASASTVGFSGNLGLGNLSGGAAPAQKLYAFNRLTATSMRVTEIVNK